MSAVEGARHTDVNRDHLDCSIMRGRAYVYSLTVHGVLTLIALATAHLAAVTVDQTRRGRYQIAHVTHAARLQLELTVIAFGIDAGGVGANLQGSRMS